MQDVLIALQTDLASNIAIRYASRLGKIARFNIQAIHIPEIDENGHSPGSGWVHQTWENAIVQKAREDIAELVQKEIPDYNRDPKIVLGERDSVVLDEMRQKQYAFLIEGLLHSFEPDKFFQKLASDLYLNLLYPVLMVKNLVDLDRGVQIVGTPDTVSIALSWFFGLWSELPIKLDILVCHFEPSMENLTFLENDRELISEIEDMFLKHGKEYASVKTAQGSSNKLVSLVRDHALLVSSLPNKSSQIAHMLAMSPCSILFCPDSKIGKIMR